LETVIIGLQNPAIPTPLSVSTSGFRGEQNFFPYSPSSRPASVGGGFPGGSRGSYQTQQSSFPTQSMNSVVMNEAQNWQADRSSPNSFPGVPRPTNERRYSNPFSVSSDSHDSHSHHSNSDSRLSGTGTGVFDNSGDAKSGGGSRPDYEALLSAMSSRPHMGSNQLPPPMINSNRVEERYPFPPSAGSPLGLPSGFQQPQIPAVSSYPTSVQQPYPVVLPSNLPLQRNHISALVPPPLLSPHNSSGFLSSGISPNPSVTSNPALPNPANNAFSFSFFADNNNTGNSDNSSKSSNNRF
jgi:hypothetical protein